VTARWRLQLLAEMSVGGLIRQHAANEDGDVARLRSATRGRG
jgi:hypothetical protein